MTELSRLGRAALAYAEIGWPVFPLKPNSKRPILMGGFHRATRDDYQLLEWWEQWPKANVGVCCNEWSGLMALDFDPRNYAPGADALELLETLHDELPETLVQETPSGGLHYVFQYPVGFEFIPTMDDVIRPGQKTPGIDVKSAGYIVAAPSTVNGKTYQWRDRFDAYPTTTPPAELPGWLLQLTMKLAPDTEYESTMHVEASFLARAFGAAGVERFTIDANRMAATCPWEFEHSGRSGHRDSSTILFAPTEKTPDGSFHCSHAHCAGLRKHRDVLAMLPEGAKDRARQDCIAADLDDMIANATPARQGEARL